MLLLTSMAVEDDEALARGSASGYNTSLSSTAVEDCEALATSTAFS